MMANMLIRKDNKKERRYPALLCFFAAVLLWFGCRGVFQAEKIVVPDMARGTENAAAGVETGVITAQANVFSASAYAGAPFVVINNNIPLFTDEEVALAGNSYERYAKLDALGRCGVCMASIGQDIMPVEERGAIGAVKPSGWQLVKYNGIVDGNYLYNRCHLIGYQLTGENANEKNLITGTRYLNVDGMLPLENLTADFVKTTGCHVLYRVTPYFEGNNLVASGVLVEAKSVEDNGAGLQFCVYCYNVQPGIAINYADGSSAVDTSAAFVQSSASSGQMALQTPALSGNGSYVVNRNNGKIHINGACPATGSGSGAMKHPVYFATYEEAKAYSEQIAPSQKKRQCGNCW